MLINDLETSKNEGVWEEKKGGCSVMTLNELTITQTIHGKLIFFSLIIKLLVQESQQYLSRQDFRKLN